uniref:BZIP domain-containing protein n=1 Tax=Periophthalmus magnuspinnatus TaxID=409849 RepID=A0A3B4ALF9_9GOBI
MYQGFPGDPDSGSRGSSSPSIESQYLSSVDSFGSPPTTSAPQVGLFSEMPGSFVPTVTAITTSQDLQWMVQPTLISSQASGQSPVSLVDPYDLPGTSYSSGSGMTPMASDTAGPGPVRQSRARSRRTRDVSLTPEEEEKRRVRRERNKLAAAKCRNRRRELTDRLQSETDILEEEKAELEAEISELQKEKERLEFVLVAHQPNCKLVYQEQPSQSSIQTHSTCPLPTPPTQPQHTPSLHDSGGGNHDGAAIGYNTSYTSSFVFTYPEGACGVSANQRNSSSEQSSDSLNSPSLLAL